MNHRRATSTLAVIATAGTLTLTLTLAGCGSSDTPGPSPTSSTGSMMADLGAHNAADTRFLMQLSELSQQAIAISQAVEARASDAQANASIGESIRLNDERLTLARNLILTWGQAAAEAPDAPGLLSEQQLNEILVATPAKFPSLVATAGTQILGGLVAISEVEVNEGENPTVKRQAETILADRKAPVPSL